MEISHFQYYSWDNEKSIVPKTDIRRVIISRHWLPVFHKFFDQVFQTVIRKHPKMTSQQNYTIYVKFPINISRLSEIKMFETLFRPVRTRVLQQQNIARSLSFIDYNLFSIRTKRFDAIKNNRHKCISLYKSTHRVTPKWIYIKKRQFSNDSFTHRRLQIFILKRNYFQFDIISLYLCITQRCKQRAVKIFVKYFSSTKKNLPLITNI